MYKTFTTTEWKKLFGLPEDYKVEGFLIYGTWNKEKQLGIFKEALTSLKLSFEINKLPDFLNEGVSEVVIDDKIYWFSVSYGGALLSEYLHLASMLGSKKNILLGSCGGLFNEVKSGDFVVPTYSYGNESTTRLYSRDVADHKHVSTEVLSEALVKQIESKHKVWRGPTITQQAMMGETLEDVQEWSSQGYYGVEMEAATVFSVSNHFKVPTGALLIVGDNLVKGEAVGGEAYESMRSVRNEATKEQYKVAINELLKV
jgi:AMP nucleosidase